MNNNHIRPDDASTAGRPDTPRRGHTRPSVRAWVTARLRAARFDRALAVGVPAPAGSALAAHAARLSCVAERHAVARALRRAVHDVTDDPRATRTRARADAPGQHRLGRGSDRRGDTATARASPGQPARDGAAAAIAVRRDEPPLPARSWRPRGSSERSARRALTVIDHGDPAQQPGEKCSAKHPGRTTNESRSDGRVMGTTHGIRIRA